MGAVPAIVAFHHPAPFPSIVPPPVIVTLARPLPFSSAPARQPAAPHIAIGAELAAAGLAAAGRNGDEGRSVVSNTVADCAKRLRTEHPPWRSGLPHGGRKGQDRVGQDSLMIMLKNNCTILECEEKAKCT